MCDVPHGEILSPLSPMPLWSREYLLYLMHLLVHDQLNAIPDNLIKCMGAVGEMVKAKMAKTES